MNENENYKVARELILTKEISSAIHREVYSILKDNNDLSLVKSWKIEKNKGNCYYQAEKEYRIGKILGLITDSVPKIYKTEKFDNNSEIEINTALWFQINQKQLACVLHIPFSKSHLGRKKGWNKYTAAVIFRTRHD